MKRIHGTIYLEVADLINAGITASAIDQASRRGSLPYIKWQQDKRVSLFSYTELPKNYQRQVDHHYKNIETYFSTLQIKNLITEDRAATDYYVNKGLSPSKVAKYSEQASIFSMLERNSYKDAGFSKATEWWQAVVNLINNEYKHLNLPKNEKALRRKLSKFKKDKYASLIHGGRGNTNRMKLGKVQKAYLREVYANTGKPQVLLISQVCWLYKQQATIQGWPQVDDRTIYNYLNEPSVQALCSKERHGKKKLMDVLPVINRKRPTYPNDMWGMDGTPFEIGYYNKDGKPARLYAFIVTDYHSWKWLSVAIGESETGELVMEALRNACILENVLPNQIQSDNSSAINRCQSDIDRIATYRPKTRVGNSRSKPVEAIQGHIQTQILKWSEAHTGAGVKASENYQVNADTASKFFFKTKEQAVEFVYTAMALWNNLENKKGESPNQLHAKENPRVRTLDIMQRIQYFGVVRRKGRPIKYTNEGITLTQKDGSKLRFIVPDEDFYVHNFNREFFVRMDPDDHSMVALFDATTDEFIEFAYEKEIPSMYIGDLEEDGKRELRRQQGFQKRIEKRMEEDAKERAELLDAELVSKIPVGIDGRFKDIINQAEEDLKHMELVGVKPVTATRVIASEAKQSQKAPLYDDDNIDETETLE